MVYVILFLLALVFYCYFLYPLIIFSMSAVRGRSAAPPRFWDTPPRVTVLVAAHNEGGSIGNKIKNTLSLEYPAEKLEVVIAADGCTDDTVEIARSFAGRGVKVIETPEHRGKAAAVNTAMQHVDSEFVVLSDANSACEPETVRRLLRHFRDDGIGVVCGRLVYKNPGNLSMGGAEGAYARYDQWIRRQESKLDSTIGAIGAAYAVRRRLFSNIEDDVCDDFAVPLLIYAKGYRVVYEEEAVACEETNENTRQAFNRKKRTILRELVALKKYWNVLKPSRGLFWFQMFSHKILRWCVPFILLAVFAATFFTLESAAGVALLAGQVVFYGAAAAGLLMERRSGSAAVLRVPLYFCVQNAAALVAVKEFAQKKSISKWNVAR